MRRAIQSRSKPVGRDVENNNGGIVADTMSPIVVLPYPWHARCATRSRRATGRTRHTLSLG